MKIPASEISSRCGIASALLFLVSLSAVACSSSSGTGSAASDSGTDVRTHNDARPGHDGSVPPDASGRSDASVDASGSHDDGPRADAGVDATQPVDAPVGTDSGHDGGGNRDAAPDASRILTSLTVTPENPLVRLDLNTAGSQPFTVTGTFSDSTMSDVTAQASFVVADSAVGTITGGTLAIPAFASTGVATSLVTAKVGAVQGEAQVTVVAYPQSGSAAEPLFIVSYDGDAGAAPQTVALGTAIPAVDVLVLAETNGGMGGPLEALKVGFTSTVVPAIQAVVADADFGVAAFEDFPIPPYGEPLCTSGDGTDDQPFKLQQTVTAPGTALTTAINGLTTTSGAPIGCGGDIPDSNIEALFQASTGSGLTGPSPTSVPSNQTGIGGAAFRPNAVPVILDVTQYMSHGPGETGTCQSTSVAYTGSVATTAHSRAQAKTALATMCARVVGVAPVPTGEAACDSEADLTDFATATDARVSPAAWSIGTRPTGCSTAQCCTGQNGVGMAPDVDGLCPLVMRAAATGTGVTQGATSGVQLLLKTGAFEVTPGTSGATTDISGNPLPGSHTTADFLAAVIPTGFTVPMSLSAFAPPTFSASSFQGVIAGTSLTVSVHASDSFVPSTGKGQLFAATVNARFETCAVLSSQNVLILVLPTAVTVSH